MPDDSHPPSKNVPFLGILLFLSIWLIVAFNPTLRPQPFQKRDLTLQRVLDISPPFLALLYRPANPEPLPNSGTPAADWFGTLKTIEGNPNSGTDYSPTFAKLKKVLARHPKEIWIRTAILRRASDFLILPHPGSTPNAVSGSRRNLRLTKSDNRDFILLAKEGALQEPQNAFFPLMEACGLYAAGQEGQAWRTLEKALKCPTYNDHALQEAKLQIQLLGGPEKLTWEERHLYQTWAKFRIVDEYRRLAAIASWRGREYMKAGNVSAALPWFETSLNIGRTVRKNRDSWKFVDFGFEISAIAWLYATTPTNQQFWGVDTDKLARQRVRYLNELADQYANLARKAGHADLASKSLADLSDEFLAVPQTPNYPPTSLGDVQAVTQSSLGDFALAVLGRWVWTLGFFWFVLMAIVAALKLPSPPKWVSAVLSVPILALFLYLLGTILCDGLVNFVGQVGSAEYIGNVMEDIAEANFMSLLIAVCGAPLLFWMSWTLYKSIDWAKLKSSRKGLLDTLNAKVAAIAIAALLLGSVCVVLNFTMDPRTWQGTFLHQPFPLVVGLVLLSITMAGIAYAIHLRLQGPRKPFRWFPILFIVARTPGVLRDIAGTLALLGSVSYLVLALAVSPSRAKMESVVNDIGKDGEIATFVKIYRTHPNDPPPSIPLGE